MTLREVIVDRRAFRLGRLIGKGGEGVVHALGDDNKFAVKLYNSPDAARKEAKIAAMVGAQLAANAPLVAFPLAIARNEGGLFLGFVMRLVGEHKPLHDLYSPGPRKNHFPQADYRFLVRAASNLARAVASVHQSQCVIGDINHSGILVSPKATVALIDADSFQFTAGSNRHLCVVGVPEYTPPELQGKSLAGVIRTPNHDAFGLAVVIFQLLMMGRHPFVGTVRKGDIPPLEENIQKFRYVYAENRDVGMDQPPGTPALSDFSLGAAALFEAAFSRETMDQRPSAAQWVKQLDILESSLAQCEENALHFVPRDASECAWCEMERRLGTVLFLPNLPRTDFNVGHFDPGANGFNLESVWAKIAAVVLPSIDQLKPRISATITAPSAAANAAKHPDNSHVVIGYLICVGAVLATIAIPPGFLLWVIAFGFGYVKAQKKNQIHAAPFSRAYIDAAAAYERETANWHQRIGLHELLRAKESLATARNAYRGLAEDERAQVTKYQSERKEKQLHAYLDTFDIQDATIKGIGPAKRATLASYGIDTAADVTRAKLLAVPGFGDTTSRGLLEWRAKLEGRFAYRTDQNDADRQEFARIRSTIESKAIPLRQQLHAGAQSLTVGLRQVSANASREDPVLTRLYRDREQAKIDLEFLGLPIPNIAQSVTSVQVPTIPSRPSARAPGAAASGPQLCPRCRSMMVKRMARRGRYAGRYFWGCSRYPHCKGTRNI